MSPFGGMEALVDFLSIGTIVRKAVEKFAVHTSTLYKGHSVQELMPGIAHPRAVSKVKRERIIRSPLVDITDPSTGPTESINSLLSMPEEKFSIR